MAAGVILVFLSVLTLLLISPTTEAADYVGHKCPNINMFTPNSTFQTNRNDLLSDLSSNATRDTSFYNTTSGSTPNTTVYGLFLCRGYLTTADCKACVTSATSDVGQFCPVEKDVVIWYNDCTLRYSDTSFFSSSFSATAEWPPLWMPNTENISTEPDGFNRVVVASMKDVASKAANRSDKFATSEVPFKRILIDPEAKFEDTITLYTLGQCTQDLSSSDCNQCLEEAATDWPDCCAGKLGGRILYSSCNVRSETYQFYNPTSPPTPPPTPPPEPEVVPARKGKNRVSSIVIPSVVAPVALCVLIVVMVRCFNIPNFRRAKRPQNKAKADMATVESLQFDLGTIEAATQKFSGDNKLGEGGFGQVFKGTLDNGQEIAVKRLSKSSRQGIHEFKNEVLLVAKLQHRNLVRLLGFCLEGEETLLVYEYVPNKSLDYFLFESEMREQLDWSIRCNIIGGIARGILYLHEDSRLRVIHRDLKASNILLDVNMHPKISDFGMARMFGVDNQTQGNTGRIVGTYGYMAPEYAMEGLYSIKSDVFSFGIILLEILTGRKNFLGFYPTTSTLTLISFAWKLWNEGKVLELMDPLLKDSCSPNEFLRYIHIGLLCVQEDANNRPTMSLVLHMLKSESISLPKPERPAYFTGRCINNQDHTLPICSANGLTISDDIPR